MIKVHLNWEAFKDLIGKEKVDCLQIKVTKNVSQLLPIAKLQSGMDWCNPGCCCILGNLRQVNYLWYLFPELVSKVKFSTVMSHIHQKLSRIGAFKI